MLPSVGLNGHRSSNARAVGGPRLLIAVSPSQQMELFPYQLDLERMRGSIVHIGQLRLDGRINLH
jgi:hypothetical protein